jgi:hypothetical protein
VYYAPALVALNHLRGLSLSEHETFALLIYCVCSGGTGKPAVVYESRAEPCPSGLFMSLLASSFESDIGKLFSDNPGYGKQMACDQAAVQSAYY